MFDRGFKIKKIEIDDTFPEFIQENKEALKIGLFNLCAQGFEPQPSDPKSDALSSWLRTHK